MASKPQPACHPRRKFITQDQARTVASAMAARNRGKGLVEACPHCNGWHVV